MNKFFVAVLAVGFFGVQVNVALAGLILSGTSYLEDFDSMGTTATSNPGLPANWTARTSATVSSLGTSVSLSSNSPVSWINATGGFKNLASSQGLTSSATTDAQNSHTNRALGVRQTGSIGDPGAAFTLEIENTLGFQGFQLSFGAHLLDLENRDTTWTVRWGSGDAPTTFTELGTFTPGVTTANTFGATAIPFSLSSAFDNSSQRKWIQIVTLTATTGSDSRDTFGIDNFSLTFSAVPEPSSLFLVGMGLVAAVRSRRRSV